MINTYSTDRYFKLIKKVRDNKGQVFVKTHDQNDDESADSGIPIGKFIKNKPG